MRRGLISRSKAELPDAVLDARLARLRAAMREVHLDALLLYTNNTRAAGVSWLTGFVPYWSEALLVVTHDRLPVLVAALTYRVKSWIERTSRVPGTALITASRGFVISTITRSAGCSPLSTNTTMRGKVMSGNRDTGMSRN